MRPVPFKPFRRMQGRDTFGASVLLARRLVEAGVTFVTVHTETKGPGHWDTHENNFNLLEHFLLPFLDRALTSLLEDLAERGLLETTLVVVTGDMGRTPRVNGKAGRDHWPQYPSILALLASPSPMRSWAPSAISPVPLARQPTARGPDRPIRRFQRKRLDARGRSEFRDGGEIRLWQNSTV